MDAIATTRSLGSLKAGDRGRITGFATAGLDPDLEHRLLRLGFAEDARIAVLHEGPVRRDPMAVRVDGVVIALRRREANAIVVEIDTGP